MIRFSILISILSSLAASAEIDPDDLIDEPIEIIRKAVERYNSLETYTCQGQVLFFGKVPPPPIRFQLALSGNSDLRLEWQREPATPTLSQTKRSLRKEGDLYRFHSTANLEPKYFSSRNQAIMLTDASSKGIFSILFDFLDTRRNTRVLDREMAIRTIESIADRPAYLISIKGYDVNLIWIDAVTFDIAQLETRRRFKTALDTEPQNHSILFRLDTQTFDEPIDPSVFE